MNENKKKIRFLKPVIAISIVLVLLMILTHSVVPAGWFGSTDNARIENGYEGAVITYRGMDDDRIYTEVSFQPREDGTFLYCEAVFPEKAWEEDVPLVVMGHGFGGGINSGGAKDLAGLLAREGIATIRMDFNPRVKASKDAAKVNTYDLNSMQEDALRAINYMCETYHINKSKIALYARSMGGRAAMMMGNESYGGINYAAMALVAPAGNETAMIYFMGGQEKWDAMKAKAKAEGSYSNDDLSLSYEWFTEFEDYNPCTYGYKFNNKPVLVIYNTLDHVVLPETSLTCAGSYENAKVIEVTTEDGHGYEMGYEESELKTYIMNEICTFLKDALE